MEEQDRPVNEQAKQAALNYAQHIIDTLRHPFLVLNGDLRVISANRSFYQSFQVSPAETDGQRVYDLGNGQWNIARLRSLLEVILPQSTTFEDYEVEHVFPIIGRRYMLLNARRIQREQDQTELILLGIEDITDCRQLEEQRREIESRFTSLVKHIKDHAIFTLDTNGCITSWNVEADRILGYTEADALGQHFSMIFTADDVEQGRPEEELRVAKEKGRAEDERWHKKKNGELFWALGLVTPMHDAHGKHLGFSHILRDMTERKQAQETLQQADRRKVEFLAMLSHELRTPLAPILNAVQLMKADGGDSEHQRTACRVIERQVRHLKRLVDDLLEVSRITTSTIRLKTARMVLNEVIERAVERIQPKIEDRRQELALSIPEQPIWMNADAARLEQVFGNLLNNASKYTEVGGHIWITVELTNDQVVVRLRDDGIGMAPDLLPHIFDLFTQADKSLDRTEGGLGIGLALVKSLIDQHDGTVEAFSDGIGRGSEFVVRLPTTSEPKAEQKPVPSPSPQDKTDSLRILVVDDDVDTAEMTSMLLRLCGHEVRIAHNGPDALHQAVSFQPHVTLLDIGLPDMDGFEVARHMRQDPHIHKVHLIAITGYGQEHDRQQSQEAGFDVHLVKPVEFDDLRRVLTDIRPTTT